MDGHGVDENGNPYGYPDYTTPPVIGPVMFNPKTDPITQNCIRNAWNAALMACLSQQTVDGAKVWGVNLQCVREKFGEGSKTDYILTLADDHQGSAPNAGDGNDGFVEYHEVETLLESVDATPILSLIHI